MAEFPALPLWTDVRQFTTALAARGWRTPDTYSRSFAKIPAKAGVYLLVAYDLSGLIARDSFIAYVGMSTALCKRLDSNHEIWQRLHRDGYSPSRWFRAAPVAELRNIERRLIRRYNPPYNIIGRERGAR